MTGAPFGRLFDKFFNDFICKKFQIAFFCLICRFGMVENQNNQSRVIYDPICGLRVKEKKENHLHSFYFFVSLFSRLSLFLLKKLIYLLNIFRRIFLLECHLILSW